MQSYALSMEFEEPNNVGQAKNSKEGAEWQLAMEEEMSSLYKNDTWDLVKLPTDRKAIGCKWVFKVKECSSKDGSDIRFKARLVEKWFAQRKGMDYNEIFSPVVRHTSIRILLAIVAAENMELEQMDVKTTFLHGELEEDIYMAQPEGFVAQGKEQHVCKLKKSLYGLKQSPRQWYMRSIKDQCVYVSTLHGGGHVYLLLYVDDMLIASKDKEEVKSLKSKLAKEFDMKDLGSAKKILGMEIQRDRNAGTLRLSQEAYVKKVLARFGMEGSKPVSMPLAPHFKLSASMSPTTEVEKAYMDKVPYASAVGSLMYAMVCMRLDLAQAVGVVSL